MIEIKLGDPMPHDCPKCGLRYGYQVYDNIKTSYTYIYDSEGENIGGAWSDYSKTTKQGKRAFCSNCGADLKIKIDRND